MVHYKLPGVIWLMIGLVVIQIVVVWAWGVEPRNRALEDVAARQGLIAALASCIGRPGYRAADRVLR